MSKKLPILKKRPPRAKNNIRTSLLSWWNRRSGSGEVEARKELRFDGRGPLGMKRAFGGWICIAAALSCALPATAEDENLADLSIQQLMNESITSVSKKETSLNQSPAAIYVVTPDDVRRMGITSIPEALRLVPGMDVARIGASEWAISARGFNGQFADKLLVLIDGRTVYDPTFSGVFWDSQDIVMEDLDRIEVIRGPGAALWGANAVNGVVNVITKSARETHGLLMSTTFGTEDQPATTLRYGGMLAPNLYYRVYVKYFDRAAFEDSSGHSARDGWDATRGGFRVDWEPSKDDTFTLQGDYDYTETNGLFPIPQFTPPFSRTLHLTDYSNGGNILGRWTHRYSDTSELTIQSYFDHSNHELSDVKNISDTADLDVQHRFALGSYNDVVWGFGYRHINNDFPSGTTAIMIPERRAFDLYTAFLQDQIAIVPKEFSVILGSKFEHNDFTGFEIQPSARLLWTPSEKQTVWAGISRAVRTPDRLDTDIRFNASVYQPTPASPPVEVSELGVSGIQSVELYAYELGYRVEPTSDFSIDATIFYNVYDKLVGTISGQPFYEGGHIVAPLYVANTDSGDSYGAEISMQWKVTSNWRLTADYSWLQMRVHPDHALEGDSPNNQAHLRSYLDLPFNLEFNSSISYVDRVITSQAPGHIPPYIRVDAGLVWHATKNLEVGVWGENLLQSRHPEFGSVYSSTPMEVPRSVMGRITWRF